MSSASSQLLTIYAGLMLPCLLPHHTATLNKGRARTGSTIDLLPRVEPELAQDGADVAVDRLANGWSEYGIRRRDMENWGELLKAPHAGLQLAVRDGAFECRILATLRIAEGYQ
jgi:hypothetical protein